MSIAVCRQFLTIVCCNLLTASFGLVSGWATINFNDLQSENSAFPTGPLTRDESSLVVSIVNVGGFIGNFAILPISQKLGIKRTIHILSIPLILSTVLTICAQNAYYLYASRLLTGIVGGSLVISIPTLINEISYDNVRGALNSLYDPSFNLGIIISFALGNFLSFMDQTKAQLIIPGIFFILMFFLPDSPDYWTKRRNDKRAINSLKFYKGSLAALDNVEHLQKLTDEKIENGKLNNAEDELDCNSKIALRDFFTPHAKKAFFIGFTSLTLSFLSGTMTILSYVTDIFTKTGSSLSTKNSSLLVSIIQISTNLLLLMIVERINRRTLYVWSSLLASVSFFFFATYCLLWKNQPEYEWMPPVCFASIIFTSSLGLLPIPYIITIEIFPKKIRQTCLAIAVSMMWIILFVLSWIFPKFLECFGLFTCIVSLGFMCMLNAVFGVFFMPETRGKSYDEIEKIMTK